MEKDSKILAIILEVWNNEDDPEDFHLWVSYIMAYGFTQHDVLEFAKKHGITVIENKGDPDDAFDEGYGALELTPVIIAQLQK